MSEWGIIVAVILGGLAIILYNRLVKLRQNYRNAYSDIEVQLKQRLDLVPQLVNTVKGYAEHESSVLDALTQARTQINTKAGVQERAQEESALEGALLNLFAVAENYPDLKADGNFKHLQEELSDIENKIAAARRYFNNAVNEFNTACEQFPSNIVASLFRFTQQTFFDVPEGQKASLEQAPEIKF